MTDEELELAVAELRGEVGKLRAQKEQLLELMAGLVRIASPQNRAESGTLREAKRFIAKMRGGNV